MSYKRKVFEDHDFVRIRNFLQYSLKENHSQKNWLIDRWNFSRYFEQIIHDSYNTWPETVGIWEDENKEIVAVVNSEGKRKGTDLGEAFFQLSDRKFSDLFLVELLDYAEKKLSYKKEEAYFINLRVNEDAYQLKEILRKRNYTLQEWKEPISSLDIAGDYQVDLPNDFRIVDANEVNDYQKGFAHGKAFGYYTNDVPDDDDAERSYQVLRKAPNYLPEFDFAVLDQDNEIVSFATIWYDKINKIGILEPVGTIPKYRRMGFGKAVIYEGINRIKSQGVEKIYVGSNQQFYLSIGFSVEYYKEIWQKKLD